jgi:hypothetical protein
VFKTIVMAASRNPYTIKTILVFFNSGVDILFISDSEQNI